MFRRERFDAVLVEREHDLLRSALAWRLAFPFGNRGSFIACYHTATARRQLLLGTADAVVCISNHVRERLLAGNPRLRMPVRVLLNGISCAVPVGEEKFSLARRRRYFEGYEFPVIGMVGAFFKNQPELIEAIPLLREAFPAIRVVLVGDDTDRALTNPIKARAEQLGVTDHLVFTGKLPHERMPDLYFDFDLTVSTFRNEGFGLIHLESLSAGTPVVCYNEGGQRDILEGEKAGLLVEGGVREFATEIARLLNDHQRRFAMGRAGVELVRTRFSAEAMAARYMELLEGLSSGRKG
jgi:phosphatidylinositol alpha-1,6-mannosyltransferase